MKKILFAFLLSLLCVTASAQNYKNDGKPYAVYCQLISYETFSGKTKVKILWNNMKEETALCDEKGEKIDLQNLIDAMNYMSKRGWEFVQCERYNDEYHYILKKQVTSDQEAKEGLYFQTDFKNK